MYMDVLVHVRVVVCFRFVDASWSQLLLVLRVMGIVVPVNPHPRIVIALVEYCGNVHVPVTLTSVQIDLATLSLLSSCSSTRTGCILKNDCFCHSA